MTDLDRKDRLWRVREGTYYALHVEPPLDDDAELAVVAVEVDTRYPRLREALDPGPVPSPESSSPIL